MNFPDLINGLFEFCGGIAIWRNVYAIALHKQVRGISKLSAAFFTSWGYWNLFYYPHLHQWMSFTGGLFIVLGNTAWVSLMWKYRKA